MTIDLPRSGTRPDAHPHARVATVDLLRGLAMVLMALDHARDYFAFTSQDPENLADPSLFLFLTRWITHLCAPIFFFLAGTSAAIAASRGKTRAQTARTLLRRGLLLVLLELTLVRAAWFVGFLADATYRFAMLQVIWALGVSMIILAGLIYLPKWLMFALTFAMLATHHAFNSLRPDDLGPLGALWMLLHVPGEIHWGPGGSHTLLVRYPIIPWPGVMALGYLAAPIFMAPPARRTRRLLAIGASCLLAFVALRFLNTHADPRPFAAADSPARTLISFLNVEKYPPSLLFLLVTLGVALVLVPALERLPTRARTFLTTFGKVPLFFYIAHLFTLQFAMLAYAAITLRERALELQQPPNFGLAHAYAAWALAVAALYPACARYARAQSNRRERARSTRAQERNLAS